MQNSFIINQMADQSCFLDIQENNNLMKENNYEYHCSSSLPAIKIANEALNEDEIYTNWENTDYTQSNEKDDNEDIGPYFSAPQYEQNGFKQIKQQPFLSTASRQRLEQLLKRDNYSDISCIKELPDNLILKVFSQERNQNVVLNIVKGVREDYECVKSEYEKVNQINSNSFIIDFYKIFYYQELFLYVAVLEMYEKTLQDEIDELRRKNTCFNQIKGYSLFFQLSFAITELACFNITHNNINPSNVFKVKEGVYKLGGIGTYHQISKESFQLPHYQINLRYFSPELLERVSNPLVEFTNKSDVYSVSAIILDIFTEMKYSELKNTEMLRRSQTLKSSSPYKQKSNNSPQFIDVFNHFKKFLLSYSKERRLFSYELIPSLLKYLNPSFQNYSELVKLINQFITLPTFETTLNISFIMKSKLTFIDLKLNIIKNNLDRLQPLLSVAKTYAESAKLYEDYGIFKKAQDHYLQSMKIYEQIHAGPCEEIVELFRSIAQVYQKKEDYEKYHEYSLKALDMVEQLYSGNHTSKAFSLNQVSWSYYFLKQGDKALQYAQSSLNMKKQLSNNHSNSSCVYQLDTVGAAYQLLGQSSQALQYFLESLNYLRSQFKGSRPDIAASLNNIGVVYEEIKEFQLSYQYYQQASQMYVNLYGNYHPLVLISKKGVLRSIKNLSKENEQLLLEKEIEDIESQILKYNH